MNANKKTFEDIEVAAQGVDVQMGAASSGSKCDLSSNSARGVAVDERCEFGESETGNVSYHQRKGTSLNQLLWELSRLNRLRIE